MALNKVWHRRLTRAFKIWDYSTAFRCQIRGSQYYPESEEQLRKEWFALLDEHEKEIRSKGE